MLRPRRARPSRRRRAGERCLQALQRAGQRELLRPRKFEERPDTRAQELGSPRKHFSAGRCEQEALTASIIRRGRPRDPAEFLQARKELRDGGGGDTGSPRELAGGQLLDAHRSEREVLRHGHRLIVRCEQTFDPSRGKGSCRRQRVDEIELPARGWHIDK